jgi:hypothetical protein
MKLRARRSAFECSELSFEYDLITTEETEASGKSGLAMTSPTTLP